MSSYEIDGQSYTHVRGSDVVRDGMFLELAAVGRPEGRPMMEVFYSDENGKMTLNTFGNDVPLPVVEWLILQAKELLLPSAEVAKGDSP
jgi:hypothetical protein